MFLFLLSMISLLGCDKKTDSKKELKMTKQVQMIDNTDKLYYAIDLNIHKSYKLYVNNILISFSNASSSSRLPDLNPWLLKNGVHNIRISLFPKQEEAFIEQKESDLTNRVKLVSYRRDKNEKGYDLKELKEFDFIKITKPIPYFEQEWEVKITDLPYELEGWSNGQDLSTWDKDVLQKKVVAYYEKLRTTLNNGDADTWVELTKKRSQET